MLLLLSFAACATQAAEALAKSPATPGFLRAAINRENNQTRGIV